MNDRSRCRVCTQLASDPHDPDCPVGQLAHEQLRANELEARLVATMQNSAAVIEQLRGALQVAATTLDGLRGPLTPYPGLVVSVLDVIDHALVETQARAEAHASASALRTHATVEITDLVDEWLTADPLLVAAVEDGSAAMAEMDRIGVDPDEGYSVHETHDGIFEVRTAQGVVGPFASVAEAQAYMAAHPDPAS